MKTAIALPGGLLEDAQSFSGSRTKREAVVAALTEFNQRHRMTRLVKAFGTCVRFMTVKEMEEARSEG